MTAPVVGQTSPTVVKPYLSNAMFATHSRRGVDVQALVPGGDAADQAASLADYIRQASASMDSFLLGTLASTFDTEVGAITVRPDGCAVICPRYRPIIALTAFAVRGAAAQYQDYTDLGAASVEPTQILLPVGPWGVWNTNQGPLQFGPGVTVPGSLYARWTTCNGWPHTWLTAAAAQGDSVLSVADTAGIVVGQTRMIAYVDEYRHYFTVTACSGAVNGLGMGGPGTITMSAQLPVNAPNDTLYPTFVSALPDDVILGAVYMTRAHLKRISAGNISANTNNSSRKADPLGAADDFALAYEMIDQYQMVVA